MVEKTKEPKVAVVIPCYKVSRFVIDLIRRIGPEVDAIYLVDDACPEKTGELIKAGCKDSRVRVMLHDKNMGVGGATITGFRKALEEGAEIVVKLDGDGQMDPAIIPRLIRPIEEGSADYAKGNRFFNIQGIKNMPRIRLFGNIILSFMTKISSGYWNIFDPTNGFIAINAKVLGEMPLDKLDRRYFFESDMLFRLNILHGVIVDVPMEPSYGDEESSLQVKKVMLQFFWKNTWNFLKRIFYNYFLRDFNVASIEIIAGVVLLTFGTVFGVYKWYLSVKSGIPVTSGTVMLAALPFLVGIQFIMSFVSFDVHNVPRTPISNRL